MTVGLALAAASGFDRTSTTWGLALVAYSALRTIRPLRYPEGQIISVVAVISELGLSLLAVGTTGLWDSPYLLSVLNAVLAAGLAGSFAFGGRSAAAATLALAIPYHLTAADPTFQETVRWTFTLGLVAVTAGYARRLFGEFERERTTTLGRVQQLAEANYLLVDLHRVAQTLPASLDLDEAIRSTAEQLRDLFGVETLAILLADETTDAWMVAAAEGVKLDGLVPTAKLPRPLRVAAAEAEPFFEPLLAGPNGPGLSPLSQCGLYAALRARDRFVGLVALESRQADRLAIRDVDLLRGVADQAALAIDNARWFSRLRTVGADEERTRIARELHDRVGQSLAYLAFELDRILGIEEARPIQDDLERLRKDVRTVVGEVREALYDLRTDVTDERDVIRTLDSFLDRVRQRSGLQVVLRHDASSRLPLAQEREMWRIAQEAVANVERHAKANVLSVTWRCSEERAVLEVADDGRGMPPGTAGRIDSYGILGMRERADAIGALLEILPGATRGTVVRCTLDVGGNQ